MNTLADQLQALTNKYDLKEGIDIRLLNGLLRSFINGDKFISETPSNNCQGIESEKSRFPASTHDQ